MNDDIILESRPDLKNIKTQFSQIGLAFFCFGAIPLAFQILLGVILGFTPNRGEKLLSNPYFVWLSGYIPMYLIGLPLAIYILKSAPSLPPKKALFTPNMSKKVQLSFAFIICIGLIYISSFLSSGLVALVELMRGSPLPDMLGDLMNESNIFFVFLMTVIIAPVMEEYFFRKVLINHLLPYGDRIAILMSAAFFGLFHGNFYQVLFTFVMGLTMGYVYVRTGKLRYTIAFHMIFNLFGGIVFPQLIAHLDFDLIDAFISNLGNANPLDTPLFQRFMAQLPQLIALELFNLIILLLMITAIVLGIRWRKKLNLKPGAISIPKGKFFKTAILNPGMLLFFAVILLTFGLSLL